MLTSTLMLTLAIALISGGCRKTQERPPAAEIHTVTEELARAASMGVPDGIKLDVETKLTASDQDQTSSDDLNIRIYLPSESAYKPAISGLLQSLGGVATSHGLTQNSLESREGILFSYSRRGYVTQFVHIHSSTSQPPQKSSIERRSGPRLAIILDDLGTDRAAAERIFALPYALTISVLPNRSHSVDIAEEAHRRGYQVMLHLPMQSLHDAKPEPQELRPGMRPDDVATLVNEFLRAVPDVTGVNNHQGSQSTGDVALMDALMPILRERELFYIDSRTTKKTVAYEAARHAGVRCASRNVPFLDDVPETSAVRKQLEVALQDAKQNGEAIAIGHPHGATLAALKEILPRANTVGVQLVFASDLVH
jgi:uncharacterized protein